MASSTEELDTWDTPNLLDYALSDRDSFPQLSKKPKHAEQPPYKSIFNKITSEDASIDILLGVIMRFLQRKFLAPDVKIKKIQYNLNKEFFFEDIDSDVETCYIKRENFVEYYKKFLQNYIQLVDLKEVSQKHNTARTFYDIEKSPARFWKQSETVELDSFEIISSRIDSVVKISQEKSEEFIENLLNPKANPYRKETKEKIDLFFKEKKVPFKFKISEIQKL